MQTVEVGLGKSGDFVCTPLYGKVHVSSYQCSSLPCAQRLLELRRYCILLPPYLHPCSLQQSLIIASMGRKAVLLI